MAKKSKKTLRMLPFVMHATRGVIRDQGTRRKTMLALLLLAVLMLIAGSTFLQEALNPGKHAGRFTLYWLACAWLTIAALLLALFDILILRTQGRAARRALPGKVADPNDQPDA